MTHNLWVLLTLFWPWLAAGLCMAEAVHLVETAPERPVRHRCAVPWGADCRCADDGAEPARGVLLAILVSAAIVLLPLGAWWLTWRT